MLRLEAKLVIRKNLSGTPEWIRTTDLLLRRQTLYPAELRALGFTICGGLFAAFSVAKMNRPSSSRILLRYAEAAPSSTKELPSLFRKTREISRRPEPALRSSPRPD